MQRSQAAGIIICGLNGSGKSALAAALSQMTGIAHLDIEAYAFEEGDNPYRAMRSKAEIEARLMEDIRKSRRFLFSAVRGDLGGELSSLYRLAVVLSAPQTVRLQRLRQRSYDRFGARMLEGGDLYAQEEAFFRFAAERSPLDAVSWLDELSCPVLYLDGRRDCGCLVAQVLAHLAEVFHLPCGGE